MNAGIEFARKLSLSYEILCKPLCRKLNLSQTSFDILMFLANNPEYTNASDIVKIRKIKANLVSVNVEKLVNEGYITRKEVKNDRRKTTLIITDKSKEIIEKGRDMQQEFIKLLFKNIDAQTRKAVFKAMNLMEDNLNSILEEEK